MLKLSALRWKAKCPRHPRFDPIKHGPDAIRGNCPTCLQLLDISAAYRRTLHLIRVFAPSLASPADPQSTPDDAQLPLFPVPLDFAVAKEHLLRIPRDLPRFDRLYATNPR